MPRSSASQHSAPSSASPSSTPSATKADATKPIHAKGAPNRAPFAVPKEPTIPGYTYRGTKPDAPTPPKPKSKTGRPRSPHPSPCGTTGAYARHKRDKEPVDEACRQANADYCRERRQAKKGKN